MNKQEMRNW